jgi:hypothetical protein
MKIDLQPNEEIINTWTVLFQPGNNKFNGKLTVTNQRLIYEIQYDVSSLSKIYDNSRMITRGDIGTVEINKADIFDVTVEKSFFAKKVHVKTTDGNAYTFNYGMLNIDPVAEAIRKK